MNVMSNLEGKEQEKTKKPYNLKARQGKAALYRNYIRRELADELYRKILEMLIIEKRYLNPDFSARDLTAELQTNSRYLSAVINSRFNTNFPSLVNEYRVKEVMTLLTDPRYTDKNVVEISKMAGFSNRQSFYSSFYRFVGTSPSAFRKQKLSEKNA